MQLKDYQTTAINNLHDRAKRLLNLDGNKKMIFKSPTGSGKTLMMADFLGHLADDRTVKPISCIWAAPRKLHEQSYNKLEQYYENSRALECSYFEDLMDLKISENEILFLNWESIRQENNIIIRENERDFYLYKVLENTRDEGRNIILIIDESHHHATSDLTQQLINDIAPKLTVDVSATPRKESPDDFVSISLEEVRKEGMIKKSVVLNEGFKNLLEGDNIRPTLNEQSDMVVLEQALKKREELANIYKTANINVNPLLCIQLPDRRTTQEDQIKEDVLQKLKNCNITTKNGKLAVYLSDEKKNLENITQNDNDTEVMIFKQAIALGWDCPRAQILALFRDWQSTTFTVQTLGRIMRMPEPKIGHYDYEMEKLNHAFVYTSMRKIELDEDVAGGYLRIHSAKRIDGYTPIKVHSVHHIRQREKTRLSPRFTELFLQMADVYKLTDKIDKDTQQARSSIVIDSEVTDIDKVGEIGKYMGVDINNESDIQKLFEKFIYDNLSPYHPEERSVGRVKDALYTFFEERLEIMVDPDSLKIFGIVLDKQNRRHFANTLANTKERYAAEVSEREEPLQHTDPWEIPVSKNYGDNYIVRNAVKSVMQPFYAANNESSIEKKFINSLEESESVKWWYKNGDSESINFAIPYTEDGKQHPFYVDFIVCFTDGKIGLYDTKGGRTLTPAGPKSDGLLDYIRNKNRTRRSGKLVGGIVTPHSHAGKASVWQVYKGKGKDITSGDSSQWKNLEL